MHITAPDITFSVEKILWNGAAIPFKTKRMEVRLINRHSPTLAQ